MKAGKMLHSKQKDEKLSFFLQIFFLNPSFRRLSTEFGSTITHAVIRDTLTEDEVILLEEEMRNNSEPLQ